MVSEPLKTATDSTRVVPFFAGVRLPTQELKEGQSVTGRYQPDWHHISADIGKLTSVHWVKAHIVKAHIKDAEARRAR